MRTLLRSLPMCSSCSLFCYSQIGYCSKQLLEANLFDIHLCAVPAQNALAWWLIVMASVTSDHAHCVLVKSPQKELAFMYDKSTQA